jgi:pyruvate/2-oxoglutarate/acetoin dehydrogenase E1 component
MDRRIIINADDFGLCEGINQAAKYRFMSGGRGKIQLVIRTQGGSGNGLAGRQS